MSCHRHLPHCHAEFLGGFCEFFTLAEKHGWNRHQVNEYMDILEDWENVCSEHEPGWIKGHEMALEKIRQALAKRKVVSGGKCGNSHGLEASKEDEDDEAEHEENDDDDVDDVDNDDDCRIVGVQPGSLQHGTPDACPPAAPVMLKKKVAAEGEAEVGNCQEGSEGEVGADSEVDGSCDAKKLEKVKKKLFAESGCCRGVGGGLILELEDPDAADGYTDMVAKAFEWVMKKSADEDAEKAFEKAMERAFCEAVSLAESGVANAVAFKEAWKEANYEEGKLHGPVSGLYKVAVRAAVLEGQKLAKCGEKKAEGFRKAWKEAAYEAIKVRDMAAEACCGGGLILELDEPDAACCCRVKVEEAYEIALKEAAQQGLKWSGCEEANAEAFQEAIKEVALEALKLPKNGEGNAESFEKSLAQAVVEGKKLAGKANAEVFEKVLKETVDDVGNAAEKGEKSALERALKEGVLVGAKLANLAKEGAGSEGETVLVGGEMDHGDEQIPLSEGAEGDEAVGGKEDLLQKGEEEQAPCSQAIGEEEEGTGCGNEAVAATVAVAVAVANAGEEHGPPSEDAHGGGERTARCKEGECAVGEKEQVSSTQDVLGVKEGDDGNDEGQLLGVEKKQAANPQAVAREDELVDEEHLLLAQDAVLMGEEAARGLVVVSDEEEEQLLSSGVDLGKRGEKEGVLPPFEEDEQAAGNLSGAEEVDERGEEKPTCRTRKAIREENDHGGKRMRIASEPALGEGGKEPGRVQSDSQSF